MSTFDQHQMPSKCSEVLCRIAFRKVYLHQDIVMRRSYTIIMMITIAKKAHVFQHSESQYRIFSKFGKLPSTGALRQALKTKRCIFSILRAHVNYVNEGYEGLMIRLDESYVQSRSKSLLKVKVCRIFFSILNLKKTT